MNKHGKTVKSPKGKGAFVSKVSLCFCASLNYFTRVIRTLNLYRLEVLYKIHLRIRYAHDSAYYRNKIYKQISDSISKKPIRRAVNVGFVFSLLVFLSLQYVLPNFFDFSKGKGVSAATNSKTFTTNGDFAYSKAGLCGQTSQSQVSISGAAYTDATCAASASDSAVSLSQQGSSANQYSISVGSNPLGIDFNPSTNMIYVPNTGSGTVSVINGATKTVTATITTGGTPRYVAVNPATNKIYVSNNTASNVAVIDGSNNTLSTTITVGSNPNGIAVNSSTNKIYVINAGNVVSIIDGSNNTVTNNITVGNSPQNLVVKQSNGYVYVTNYSSANVSVINGTSVVATVSVGTNPNGIGINQTTGKVYVSNWGGSSVSVINGTSVEATVSITANPQGIGVDYSLNRIYVANQNSNLITIINGSNNTVLGTISSGGSGPVAVAVDSGSSFIYIENYSGGTVFAVDGTNNVVSGTVSVGNAPYEITYNSNNNKVYVANWTGSSVSVINTSTNTVSSTITGFTNPYGISANSQTNKVYVANGNAGTVSVINGATDSITKTINVGSAPRTVAVNTLTNMIYVANSGSNTVSVIDGSTDTVSATINVGSSPLGVGVNSATNRIYVSNNTSANVSVINGANNGVIATVGVGSAPRGIAVNTTTNKIYVVNNTSNNVSVINGGSNTVSSTISVGTNPEGNGVNSVTNQIYIANYGSGNISVINGSTDTVTTNVTVGLGPVGVAVNNQSNKVYISNYSANTVSVINKNPSYISPGTMSSLKVDAGAEQKAKWNTLSWQSAALPANTSIVFKARASDNNSSWSSWTSDITQNALNSTSGTGSISSLASSRYLEVMMTLTSSDGVSTPTLNDFTVSYDSLEPPTQANLFVRKADGTTPLKTYYGADVLNGTYGGNAFTNESTIRVTAGALTCTGCGASDNKRPQVQVSTLADQTFSTPVADVTATAGNSYANISGLVDGTSYHMRVRAIDDQGRVSGWTSYGGNAETESDFSVDQQAPSGTLTINSAAAYTNTNAVTLNLTASDTGGSSYNNSNAWTDIQFSNDGTNWGVTTDGTGAITDTSGNCTSPKIWYGGTCWMDFANTASWNLISGDGQKNVYYRVRDNAGNVSGKVLTNQADLFTGKTTNGNIDGTSVSGDLKLGLTSGALSVNYGTGADGDYTLSATKTIKTIYETDLGKGVGTYNPSTGAIPNFNNLTISGTGIMSTDGPSGANPGTQIAFRVKGTLTIQTGGSIDAIGKGYGSPSWVADGGTYNGYGPGGGGGDRASSYTCGGAGGGFYGTGGYSGTSSVSGYGSCSRLGGVSYQVSANRFGSGGGTGAGSQSNGGAGGGAIIIYASTISNAGSILAYGSNGSATVSGGTYNGGGGGSGGSVHLVTSSFSTTTGAINVKGGNGASSTLAGYGAGGGGGGGVIYVQGTSQYPTTVLTGGTPGTVVSPATIGASGAVGYSGTMLSYLSPGTLGETGTPLSYTAGSTQKWTNLNWSADTLATGQAIKFMVSTDGTNWKGPSGAAGDWTTNYFGQAFGGAAYNTIPTSLSSSTTLYVKLQMTSDGTNTPVLHDISIQSAAIAQITLDTAPPSPPSTNLTVTPAVIKNSNVTVSWDAATDPSGIKEYKVYRKKDDGTYDYLATVTSPTHTYLDTSLATSNPTNQGLFYYRVTATDTPGNEGSQSVDFPVLVSDYTGPDAPTGLSVDPMSWSSNDIFTFDFSATDPQISGQNAAKVSKFHYRVDQAPDQAFVSSNPGNTIDVTDANPATGQKILTETVEGSHVFYIVAEDEFGNVNWSNIGQINYYYDKTPATPPVLRYSASESSLSSIQLYWDPASDPSSVTAYKIRRKKGGTIWGGPSTYETAELATTPTALLDTAGLESGFRYNYQISVKDGAGNWSDYNLSFTTDGFTTDDQAPNPAPIFNKIGDPTQGAFSCNGVSHCSNALNKGFEVHLKWTAAADSGVGLSKYLIYRSTVVSVDPADWQVVGVVSDPGGAPLTEYYDNDVNNAATDPDYKPVATANLNDSSEYYYRIVAVDAATPANRTELFPVDTLQNLAFAVTPDVTKPTVPTTPRASALGAQGNKQAMLVTWGTSYDRRARSQEDGSGVNSYKIYRYNTISLAYDLIHTTANANTLDFTDTNLEALTEYTYRVIAVDNVGLESDPTADFVGRTASDKVPTTIKGPFLPDNSGNKYAAPRVISTKGDPNADPNVGHRVVISFTGSEAKACGYDPVFQRNIRCLTKYEIYRSDTNLDNKTDWLNPIKATKVTEITPINTGNDTANTYSYNDNNLSDTSKYFYTVIAYDDSPSIDTGGAPGFSSPISNISESTLYAGWDITPDATKPVAAGGTMDVKVRDTHPNEAELRNIITWQVVKVADVPTRNGQNDFYRYEVVRETYNPTTDALLNVDVVKEEYDMSVNYFMDVIALAFKDLKYKYYVQIVDDAGVNYKYASGERINDGFSNMSEKYYSSDTIIPSKAKPVLVGSVVLNNIQVASADVIWTTDQDADSLVQFRQKGSNGQWDIDGQIDRTLSHFVKLKGLKPRTEYEYRIISRNYLGNNIEDAGTLPVLVTTGFDISGTKLSTTTSTAEINWTTNLDASSAFIEYQLNRQGGDEPQSGTAGVAVEDLSKSPRSHRVVVKGLRSNRTYTYKIKSISTDGFVAETEFLSFKTRNFDSDQFTLTPSSSNVAERNITATTAQIIWQTGSETTSWVDYSTKSGVYDNSAGNDNLTTQHVVVLEGLVPGTVYYYRVRVKDANEVEFTSQEYTFKAVLKPKISNMRVKDVTPYSVTISWDTNVETETIINWGKTAGYGEKRGVSGMSKVHEIKVENLEDNQEYHYQILAKDEAGNEVADDDKIIRTPLDKEGPKIENVKLDVLPMGESDSSGQVIVSWSTNKPATTMVEYDEGVIGGRYSLSTVEDKSLNTSHTVIIKELKPATSYHYRIVSKDKRENTTISQDFTFVTPTKEKSILQLILKSLEDTFSWTKNLNQFFGNIGRRLTGN